MTGRYAAAWSAVRSLLGTQSDLQARVVADVHELYRPDVEGAAYLDFALSKDGKNAGHVIASTGGHDFPIIAWSAEGTTRVRMLEQLHQVDLRNARIHMVAIDTLVAERPDGTLLSTGTPLTREAWATGKQALAQLPAAQKAQFAKAVAADWKRLAEADQSTVLPAEIKPDDPGACPVEGCGGEPCRAGLPNWPACMQCQGGQTLVRGIDLMDLPPYYQWKGSFNNGYCHVGCGPVATSVISAWAARQAGDHRDGRVWGHPRMAYSFSGSWTAWPTQALEGDAYEVITQWRDALGTYCNGEAGSTNSETVSAFANSYFSQKGIPLTAWASLNSSQSTYSNEIGYQVGQLRAPVEIMAPDNPFSTEGHHWIVYGVSWSSCAGNYYKVHLGWGWSHYGEWINSQTILNNLTASPWYPFDDHGIVSYYPFGLWRDHGPITTGAGSSWCLDPGWGGANGDFVWQYTCYGQDNQSWYLDRPNTTQQGWLVRNKYSGRCLAPYYGGSFNGAQVVQWTCDPNDINAMWHLARRGDRVALRHAASGRCLDVDDAGGIQGNLKKIQTWDCHYGYNQLFDFAP